MSCIAYKVIETEESSVEKQGESGKLKPFVVPNDGVRAIDRVATRVAEVLDYELSQGSMPA